MTSAAVPDAPAGPRRLLAYMVTKNEASRYLDACLSWAKGFLDGIAVYDDQSTDDTVELAESHGALVSVRAGSPSFLLHEGQFRQRAWRWLEEALEPEPGDWVLALDADEFLMSRLVRPEPDTGPELRAQINSGIEEAETYKLDGIRLRIAEVFAATEVNGAYVSPEVRRDGFWPSIAGIRLFRYEPNGVFENRAMGCGAAPTYVALQQTRQNENLALVHVGYLDPEDRREKHRRYSTLTGHNQTHVASILKTPRLEPWALWPPVWRGRR